MKNLDYILALRASTIELVNGSWALGVLTKERQYWLRTIPRLSQDQLVRLRDILVNEKVTIQRIEENYAREMEKEERNQRIAFEDFARLAP